MIKYYTRQNSPVYTCFLDASKAFDRISHWTLFKKLIACNTPVLIVRILMFWYQRQSLCVKWGKRTSEYFSIINGVRQGGVLSPQLFAIYMNDLSVCLNQCKTGCHLNETVTNHVMYVDICLMAPSAIAVRKILNLCYEFSLSNDNIFSPIKSQCMVFKPNRFKLYCPAVYLNGNIIDYVEKTKYLRYMFTNDKQDDVERSKRVQPTRGWTVAAQRSTNCTHSSCPPQWMPVSTVFWTGRPSGPAAWLALLLLKAGDLETNPGPKHTRTQVWICDICHREITRKQTSLRCNHSEHWVHLRCAHIRVDQYTDTWICHLHRGSRLPHATYTSPHFPLASSKPLLHSPPTPPTPPHPKHQHTSNSPTSPPKMTNPRLPKPLTHSPPTPPTPPPAKQIHISHKTPSPSTTPRISITTRTSNAAERPVPVSSPSATNTQVTLNTTIATPTATAPPT